MKLLMKSMDMKFCLIIPKIKKKNKLIYKKGQYQFCLQACKHI